MDAKITKERLGLLLSYDWIKIACICIAAVAAWLLLFTSTATRPTRGQAFELYTYPGASLQVAPDLAKWQSEGALSFDVLEVRCRRSFRRGRETSSSSPIPATNTATRATSPALRPRRTF